MVSTVSGTEPRTTTIAYPLTSRPTCERERCRSEAMSVSRPIGISSVETNAKAAADNTTSAAQARRGATITRPTLPSDPGRLHPQIPLFGNAGRAAGRLEVRVAGRGEVAGQLEQVGPDAAHVGRRRLDQALPVRGADEVGDTLESDLALAADISEMFAALGLPQPKPVPLMKLHHQVAQKLHGLTDKTQTRPHDLVDLQLIFSQNAPDLSLVRNTCERLFAHRRRQSWPAKVSAGDLWEAGYVAAKYDLPVKPTVAEAIEWVNDLIDKITQA